MAAQDANGPFAAGLGDIFNARRLFWAVRRVACGLRIEGGSGIKPPAELSTN